MKQSNFDNAKKYLTELNTLLTGPLAAATDSAIVALKDEYGAFYIQEWAKLNAAIMQRSYDSIQKDLQSSKSNVEGMVKQKNISSAKSWLKSFQTSFEKKKVELDAMTSIGGPELANKFQQGMFF